MRERELGGVGKREQGLKGDLARRDLLNMLGRRPKPPKGCAEEGWPGCTEPNDDSFVRQDVADPVGQTSDSALALARRAEKNVAPASNHDARPVQQQPFLAARQFLHADKREGPREG